MVITKKEIKPILTFISQKYNISLDVLKLEVDNIINSIDNTDINLIKCHAYIILNGNKVQCSRSKKNDCGDFCLTHNRHNNNNELKYGKINIKDIPINNNIKDIPINNNIKDIPINNNSPPKKKIEVEYLSLNNIDYLFNPITKYVYDFETKKKLGKLDNDQNIIKKYKKNINNMKN